MPTTLKSTLEKIVVTLNDLKSTSYTLQSLVGWVNDGQRDIHVKRRDLFNVEIEHPLVAGVRQALPANSSALIDIPSNATGGYGPVTRVQRSLLDAQAPGWRARAGSLEIDHFMYDERNARLFDVYPPAIAGSIVLLNHASVPADLAIPAVGTTLATLLNTINVNVSDLLSTALQHYVCFRALSVGTESVELERAQAQFTMYTNSLHTEIASLRELAPRNAQ